MSLIRRLLLTSGAVILMVFAIGARYYWKGFSRSAVRNARLAGHQPLEEPERRRLDQHLAALRAFAAAHGYNAKIAFLVDMGLPSGKYRFFVVDLEKDTLVLAGLVAHGSANHTFAVEPNFSNADGSGCTSVGRYRIGAPYFGRFGRSYKLYGLDSTNSQASRRNIVLHSFSYVPEAETDPLPICNSLGCPMVSRGFFQQLEPLIDHSSRPIVLWIFN
ncbi:MAG TPA: murein L,D-transpeptidase catalytic domain family protein [Puia sp.]|nr:murein L,D-transpeptidase catalytic domain family protein [Puia sp.]